MVLSLRERVEDRAVQGVKSLWRAAWSTDWAPERRLCPDQRVQSGQFGCLKVNDRPGPVAVCVGDWVLAWGSEGPPSWTPYRYFLGAYLWLELPRWEGTCRG